MTTDLFSQVNHEASGHVIRLHPVSDVSKIITQKAIMAFDGVIIKQPVRRTAERWYIKQLLRNAKLLHGGCHASR